MKITVKYIKNNFKTKQNFVNEINKILEITKAKQYSKKYPTNNQLKKMFPYDSNTSLYVNHLLGGISKDTINKINLLGDNNKIDFAKFIANAADSLKTLNASIIADNIIKQINLNNKDNKNKDNKNMNNKNKIQILKEYAEKANKLNNDDYKNTYAILHKITRLVNKDFYEFTEGTSLEYDIDKLSYVIKDISINAPDVFDSYSEKNFTNIIDFSKEAINTIKNIKLIGEQEFAHKGGKLITGKELSKVINEYIKINS